MDMAHSELANVKKPSLGMTEDQLQAFVEALGRGERPADIANRLAPNDRAQRKLIRNRLRQLTYHDGRVAAAVAAASKAEMLYGLQLATQALVRKASRGDPQAIKLLYEASGFHNPRIEHKHSGEIKISLNVPRPTFDTDVVDGEAEVIG